MPMSFLSVLASCATVLVLLLPMASGACAAPAGSQGGSSFADLRVTQGLGELPHGLRRDGDMVISKQPINMVGDLRAVTERVAALLGVSVDVVGAPLFEGDFVDISENGGGQKWSVSIYPRFEGVPVLVDGGRLLYNVGFLAIRVNCLSFEAVTDSRSNIIDRAEVVQRARTLDWRGAEADLETTMSLIDPLLVYARPSSDAVRRQLGWPDEDGYRVFRPTWLIGQFLTLMVDARTGKVWRRP